MSLFGLATGFGPATMIVSSWSPTVIGSPLKVWYDGDSVSAGAFQDKSGNGNHITITTSPTLAAIAALNNQLGFQLDGATDYLERPTFASGTITQPFTIYVITQLAGGGGGSRYLIEDGSNGAVMYERFGSNPTLFAGTILQAGSAGSDVGAIFRGVFNGASSKGRVIQNGVADITWTGDAGSNDLPGIIIGRLNSGLAYWTRPITGALIISGDYSASEDANLIPWLQTRFGITPA